MYDQQMTDEEMGETMFCIFCHTFFGEYVMDDLKSPKVKHALEKILPKIDEKNKHYDRCVENGKLGAKYGHLGGRPRKNSAPKNPLGNPLGNPLACDENFSAETLQEQLDSAILNMALGYTIPLQTKDKQLTRVKHIPPNAKLLRELATKHSPLYKKTIKPNISTKSRVGVSLANPSVNKSFQNTSLTNPDKGDKL